MEERKQGKNKQEAKVKALKHSERPACVSASSSSLYIHSSICQSNSRSHESCQDAPGAPQGPGCWGPSAEPGWRTEQEPRSLNACPPPLWNLQGQNETKHWTSAAVSQFDTWPSLTSTLSRTYEGQDAEPEVVSDRGDDSAHPQNSECGVTARDDQVTRQIPEHVPAQQVTLKTIDTQSCMSPTQGWVYRLMLQTSASHSVLHKTRTQIWRPNGCWTGNDDIWICFDIKTHFW